MLARHSAPVDRAEGSGQQRLRATLAACALLAAIAIAPYVATIGYPFQFDDYPSIVQNRHLDSWNPSSWRLIESPRRIVAATFALTRHLAGADPGWFRAGNVLIHALNACLGFLLVRQALRAPRSSESMRGTATALALIAAALFAAHPLATQAVTYIVQRCESLAALCLLACLYAAGRIAGDPAGARRWSLLLIAAAAVGTAAKEVVVVATALVPLYWRCCFHDSWRSVITAHGRPLAAMVAITVALALSDLSARHLGRADWAATTYASWDPWTYLATQAQVVPHYLRLAAWPTGQCFDYLWAPNTGGHAWLAVTLMLLVAGALLAAAARGRSWAFAPAAACVVLAPTSSVFPVLDAAVEHRMYLPLLALSVTVVIACHALAARSVRIPLAVVAGLVVSLLAVAAHQRNGVYASHESLWGDVAAKRPGNVRAHYNLGLAYQAQGREAEAEAAFGRALALNPGFPPATTALALRQLGRGDATAARGQLQRGLAANPRDAQNLALLGQLEASVGDDAAAARLFARALELDPRNGTALIGEAFRRFRLGDNATAETLARLVASDAIADEAPNARMLLAQLALRAGQVAEAESDLRRVLERRPDHAEAIALLARLLAAQGRRDEARAVIAAAPTSVRNAPPVRAAETDIGAP